MTTEQYQTSRRAKSNSGRLSRDPEHAAWLYRQRNPRDLEPTDAWFRRHPNAKCRIVASSGCGGKFWNVTFYPRRGLGCELFAENLSTVLAERFPTGTPRERLLKVFDWLKAGGCFSTRAA